MEIIRSPKVSRFGFENHKFPGLSSSTVLCSVSRTPQSPYGGAVMLQLRKPQDDVDNSITRPLLTVISPRRSMIFPFLWQISKGLSQIVDNFIFVLAKISVESLSSDCFEYLSQNVN